MKTLKFKHSLATQGYLLPQHPSAKLGRVGRTITLEATEVPSNETYRSVAKLLDQTALPADVFSVKYSDLVKNLH